MEVLGCAKVGLDRGVFNEAVGSFGQSWHLSLSNSYEIYPILTMTKLCTRVNS